MSLTAALTGALSSLQANQKILTIIAANISNANTVGYSAQEPSLTAKVADGQTIGVDLGEIKRRVDNILLEQIQSQSGATGKSAAVKEFMEKVMFLFGQPNSGNDLSTHMNDFFNKMSAVAAAPSDFTVQSLAVNSAATLANFLSTTSNSLIDTQFTVEKEIGKTVTDINNTITSLKNINTSITTAISQGQSTNALLDQRDQLLEKLSSMIPITVQQSDEGQVTIFASNGASQFNLLNSQGSNVRLSYTRATTENVFVTDDELNSINIEFLDNNNNVLLTQEFIAGGNANNMDTAAIGGKLGGLLQIRDQEIPNLMEMMGNIASQMIYQVNKLHNNGVSLPPPDTLNGTYLSDTDTAISSISGSTMFAVLNSDGSPVASPWSHLPTNDEGDALLPPLIIDYDALGSNVTPALIQKEFNEYYNEIEDYVSIGPLGNLDIRGNTATGSGPITSAIFNLEGMNISSGDATIVVNSINVSGGGGSESVAALPSGLTGGFDIEAGSRSFSGSTFQVNFDGTNTHTISVNVTVTDADGNTYDSVVTFSFDPNQANSNVEGERYPPVSANQDGTIVSPNPLSSIATMNFVDADGDPIPTGSEGYMQITTNTSGTGIGINELDGQIGTTLPKGMSHYFGLNDFFVETRATSANPDPNQSLNIAVRSDLISNPSALSRGHLTLSQQPSGSSANPLVTYEIGAGSGQVAEEIVSMFLSSHSFSSAGGLPSLSASLSEYASTITEIVSLRTNTATTSDEQEALILDGLKSRSQAYSGVNVDSELANSILFQNAFSAAARVIRTVDELFDELLSISG